MKNGGLNRKNWGKSWKTMENGRTSSRKIMENGRILFTQIMETYVKPMLNGCYFNRDIIYEWNIGQIVEQT